MEIRCDQCINKNICRYSSEFQAVKKRIQEETKRLINDCNLDYRSFGIVFYCGYFKPSYRTDKEKWDRFMKGVF